MELGKITAWLTSEQPYAQGVALYAQVGTNQTYLRLFALPATAYSQGVLVRELTALVGEVREEIKALDYLAEQRQQLPDRQFEQEVLNPPPAAGVDSPQLAQLRDQLRAVRDERSHLHPQLTARNLGKKARYVLAARILELTDQEGKLKDLEAHVRQHGRLPGPVATADVTDAGVLRQRLGNLMSLRSKIKKNPDRADDLVAAEAEITLIRSKLNS